MQKTYWKQTSWENISMLPDCSEKSKNELLEKEQERINCDREKQNY